MYVIAIDPGITTGVAVRYPDDTIQTFVDKSRRSIVLFLKAATPDYVVIERFATSGRLSSFGLETIELVGMVEATCWLFDIPLHVATPIMRKPCQAIAKNLLKQIGLDFTIHEEDALAHLLAFERGQRIATRLR